MTEVHQATRAGMHGATRAGTDGGLRLGMLTPSSNTVLEPVTAAMVADLPGVSAHFSRFRVTRIGLSPDERGQFSHRRDRARRRLSFLADAHVDTVAWNGTSAAWLGFEEDERLCGAISEATGIAACTSVLAFREVFAATGVRRVGLVTPYLREVQERIAANWGAAGFACSAERHCGLNDNFSFAAVEEATLAAMVRTVAAEGCDAVAIVCTNLKGASLAPVLEREIGCPVYDSIALTLWKSLRLAGFDTRRLGRWGELFRSATLNPAPDAA